MRQKQLVARHSKLSSVVHKADYLSAGDYVLPRLSVAIFEMHAREV